MTKVILYADSSDSLYLHKHGTDDVYCHIEVNVPYGATFEQDASEIADGVEPDATVERMSYAEFAATGGDTGIVRAVAIWEEGKIRKIGEPGVNGQLYLRNPSDFDDNDEPVPFNG